LMNAKQRLAAPLRGRSPASAVYAAGAARLLLARKPKKSDADLKPTPNRGNVGQVRAKIVTMDRDVMLQMAEVAACGGSSEILALIEMASMRAKKRVSASRRGLRAGSGTCREWRRGLPSPETPKGTILASQPTAIRGMMVRWTRL
jgi:hypothetical protein